MRLCSLIVIEVSSGFFLFGVYGCLVRLGFVWMFGWIVDFVVVVVVVVVRWWIVDYYPNSHLVLSLPFFFTKIFKWI